MVSKLPRTWVLSIFAAAYFVIAGQAIARAEETGVDVSALDEFWSIQAKLAEDVEPDEEDWDRLAAHPVYQKLLSRKNSYKAFLRELYKTAYMPSRAKEREEYIARSKFHALFINHLDRTVSERALIDDFLTSTHVGDGDIGAFNDLASVYLPAGAIERSQKKPGLAFAVFTPDAYPISDLIVVDVLFAKDMGASFENLVAHELHHVYANELSRFREIPTSDDRYLVIQTLDYLAGEGVADLIDKKRAPISSFPAYMDDYMNAYNEAFSQSYVQLWEFDRAMQRMSACNTGCGDIAGEISELLPFGGHPQGFHMALAIRDIFGTERVVETVGDPVAFFRAYQEAAHQAPSIFYHFSDETMNYLDRLERELSK